MKTYRHPSPFTFVVTLLGSLLSLTSPVHSADAPPTPDTNCPPFGWAEGLGQFLSPTAPLPTKDTVHQPGGVPDCNFHQWSWEAFVWATALTPSGVPRFMTLPTQEELINSPQNVEAAHPRQLKLASRSLILHGTPGYTEGAGAFVQADFNVLVAPNGYPVLASIHMNSSYFNTVKKNLIVDGGYTNQPENSYFDLGAVVFKATWLRLDEGEAAPAGAYTTTAQVQVLTKTARTILPAAGQFVTATVALVGLHVVGYTVDHPEFLWSTFEHKLNAPSVADGTFSTNASNPTNYTFYKANTSYRQVNLANVPPALTFDTKTQRFSPVNNVVQQNRTGGEDSPHGPGNIAVLNTQAQQFLSNLKSSQSTFASYDLIGTVWTSPNTYTNAASQITPVGSVNLANTTAETFVQFPGPTALSCFSCHSQFLFPNYDKLPSRRIAISHVVAYGSAEAVANQIPQPPDPSTIVPPKPMAERMKAKLRNKN